MTSSFAVSTNGFAVSTTLTPSGRLGITGDLLEDLAADALLPRPADPSDLHRPSPSHLPLRVRVTVERLAD
jgi:hypothetical protein